MITKKRVITVIAAIVVICGLVYLAYYEYRVNSYQSKVKNMSFAELDFGKIPDGTYIGECDADFIFAKVRVTVLNGAVTGIELLEHKNDKGILAERIPEDIVREQKFPVDAVSGATNSSKVIMKAVENALTQK